MPKYARSALEEFQDDTLPSFEPVMGHTRVQSTLGFTPRKGDFLSHEMVTVETTQGKKKMKRPMSADEYRHAFNENMYTYEAENERTTLRKDPSIVEELDLIWLKIDWTGKRAVPPDQRLLSKKQYVEFHNKMVRVLYGSIENFQLTKMAEEDWKRDSRGQPFLKKKDFHDAIYETADIWTLGTDAGEYLRFLRTIRKRIEEKEPPEAQDQIKDAGAKKEQKSSTKSSNHRYRARGAARAVSSVHKLQVKLKSRKKPTKIPSSSNGAVGREGRRRAFNSMLIRNNGEDLLPSEMAMIPDLNTFNQHAWEPRISREQHRTCTIPEKLPLFREGGARGASIVVTPPPRETYMTLDKVKWANRLWEEAEKEDQKALRDRMLQSLQDDEIEDGREVRHGHSRGTVFERDRKRLLTRLYLEDEQLILVQPQLSRSVVVQLNQMHPRPHFQPVQELRQNRRRRVSLSSAEPMRFIYGSDAKAELWKYSTRRRPVEAEIIGGLSNILVEEKVKEMQNIWRDEVTIKNARGSANDESKAVFDEFEDIRRVPRVKVNLEEIFVDRLKRDKVVETTTQGYANPPKVRPSTAIIQRAYRG